METPEESTRPAIYRFAPPRHGLATRIEEKKRAKTMPTTTTRLDTGHISHGRYQLGGEKARQESAGILADCRIAEFCPAGFPRTTAAGRRCIVPDADRGVPGIGTER